ncbi:MAG: hypothetical protein RR561_07370 [Peptostreptococcus sp.]|uniref:hypothetical protein n=1 Tax=Peptostreptococcus sp. TaxID=1262 RepID=UPI002FC5B5A9
MAYILKEVKMRTNNSPEGMEKISALWRDVISGKLPVLFDSDKMFKEGISLISRYSNYESDETGEYDLSIMGVDSGFFAEMELKVERGLYKKYDVIDISNDEAICAKNAWNKVWSETKSGVIKRSFEDDFDSTVSAEYSGDGKAHCYLYISIEKEDNLI